MHGSDTQGAGCHVEKVAVPGDFPVNSEVSPSVADEGGGYIQTVRNQCWSWAEIQKCKKDEDVPK
jgi:hypothetical protein